MEQLKYEYLSDEIVEPEYYNYRIDKRGKRHYVRIYEDGFTLCAPGFHTVLDEAPNDIGLDIWFKKMTPEQIEFFSVNSANYGTYFHVMCGRLLKGETIPLNKEWLSRDMESFFAANELDFHGVGLWMKEKNRDIRKDLIGFIIFCQEKNFKPIAIEYPVMERHGLVATTIDIVGKMIWNKKERTVIIDLKSGIADRKYNDIQLYVGKKLWEQEFPDIQIEMLFNYAPKYFRMGTLYSYIQNEKKKNEKDWKKKPFHPWDLVNQTESKNIWKWRKYLSLYHGNPDNMKGIGLSLDFNSTFELNLESDIADSLVIDNALEDLSNKELF